MGQGNAKSVYSAENDTFPNDRQSYNLEVITAQGREYYLLDNSGKGDVSDELQKIFDRTAEITANTDGGASYIFSHGIFYINKALTVRHANVRIVGSGHSGIDIHGINIAGGTCLRFGADCMGDCLCFEGGGAAKSFPGGQSGWDLRCARVEIKNLTFVGHNNTGVDTAKGYSRMKKDLPNFRQLYWYPAKDRYENIERDGQRAIAIKKIAPNCKPEMLKVSDCCFTDLYVALDVEACDVSQIRNNWFAQLVYGIRFHGSGEAIFLSDNCFADLETAVIISRTTASTLHNNSFAFVSKCFVLGEIHNSSINSNVVRNWSLAINSAGCGAFIHVSGPGRNITMTGNSIFHEHDSRCKTISTDEYPNGRSFIQFENCQNLLIANNIIDTLISEQLIRLINCHNVKIDNNISNPEAKSLPQNGLTNHVENE